MSWSARARMLPLVSLTAVALLSAACGDDDDKGGESPVDAGPGSGDEGAKMDGGGAPRMDATVTPPSGDSGPSVVETPDGAIVPVPGSDDAAVPPAVATPLPSDGNRRSVCYADKPCNGDDLTCYAPGQFAYPGICTDDCAVDTDCPAVQGIAQTCSPQGQCRVDCSGAENKGDGACPVNEICRDTSTSLLAPPAWRCTYPDNSGARAAKTYEKCSALHGSGDCATAERCHVPYGGPALPLPTSLPENYGAYCTTECMVATDCPVPAGTTATPVCDNGRCEFDCRESGKNACPNADMNCRDIAAGLLTSEYRCVYLAP